MTLYVLASIRFDDVRHLKLLQPKPHFEAGRKIPGGQRPLAVQVWENPDKNSVAAYTITIHGDIEGKMTEVTDYLERLTRGREVRNGICQIRADDGDLLILDYTEGQWRTTLNEGN